MRLSLKPGKKIQYKIMFPMPVSSDHSCNNPASYDTQQRWPIAQQLDATIQLQHHIAVTASYVTTSYNKPAATSLVVTAGCNTQETFHAVRKLVYCTFIDLKMKYPGNIVNEACF